MLCKNMKPRDKHLRLEFSYCELLEMLMTFLNELFLLSLYRASNFTAAVCLEERLNFLNALT